MYENRVMRYNLLPALPMFSICVYIHREICGKCRLHPGCNPTFRAKLEIGTQLQIYFNLHEILPERKGSENRREEIRER